MMSETHEFWIERLSDYLDGDLDAAPREELEAHLAACGSCRRVLEDLRALVAEAGGLGELPPARDLWPGIAAAIGAPVQGGAPRPDGIIPLPTAARPRPKPSGIFLTLPQLAAAAVVLAVISVSATLWVGPGMGMAPTRAAAVPAAEDQVVFPAANVAEPSPELSAELDVLEKSLAASRDKLEPNTVRILEKNLGVIERAIDESRQALALDPGNAFLRQHLERAYQDKVDYLRQAASVADWAS